MMNQRAAAHLPFGKGHVDTAAVEQSHRRLAEFGTQHRLGAALQDRDTTALLRRWRRGVRGLLRNFLRGERQHRSNRLQESDPVDQRRRSEEHTSELQSLMRNSYAVFCLKTK